MRLKDLCAFEFFDSVRVDLDASKATTLPNTGRFFE
jgi:hypothetical protein